jgi:ketosteroid isomerase-like protein
MTNATDPLAAALVAANEAFYDAFDMGDYQAMAAVWAADHPVACVHPGSETIMGRDAVLRSWHDILSASSRPAIQCLEPKPLLFQQVGLVVCIEALAGGRLAASNLFVMENGRWRMVHHQAGPLNTVVPLSGPKPN